MHRRYRELLTPILGSFVYASEEAEPEVIGDNPDPDRCVLVDPLDTSELAVRGLLGYTHVMVYSRAAARPVIARSRPARRPGRPSRPGTSPPATIR
jgi:myo-inositol-1(or 4)-monophosphatase